MLAFVDQRVELFTLLVAELHDVLLYRSLLRSHDASPPLRSHRFRDPHQNQRRGAYDARSFYSLQSHKHPMGFMRLDRHFHEADRIWQRWRRRTFLTQDLLLRFHLQASGAAKALLEAARQGWTIADLATYEDELRDVERIGHLEERLIRIRSDADPASVSMERLSAGDGLKVWIEPPAEQVDQIVHVQEEYQELGRVMSLVNWVIGTEQANAVDGAITVAQAIELAKRLQESPQPKEAEEFYLVPAPDGWRSHRGDGVGSRAVWL